MLIFRLICHQIIYLPSTEMDKLYMSFNLIITIILQGKCYNPHFTVKKCRPREGCLRSIHCTIQLIWIQLMVVARAQCLTNCWIHTMFPLHTDLFSQQTTELEKLSWNHLPVALNPEELLKKIPILGLKFFQYCQKLINFNDQQQQQKRSRRTSFFPIDFSLVLCFQLHMFLPLIISCLLLIWTVFSLFLILFLKIET